MIHGPAQNGGHTEAEHRADGAIPAMGRSDLGHQTPQEEDGLGTLPEDAGEGDHADRPEAVARFGVLDATVHLTAQGARVLAHPPAVPRQEPDRGEDDGGRDQIGAEIQQGPGQHGDRDAHENTRHEAEPGARRHTAELITSSDAIEGGVHESEQQRCFETLARGDDEGGAHVLVPGIIRVT